MACNTVLAAATLLLLIQCNTALAQRLTGNLTGSGATCIPDVAFSAGTGLGQGCADGEACCTTTNTCVKKSTCSDFMRICPPPSCGKDTNFQDTEVRRGCIRRGSHAAGKGCNVKYGAQVFLSAP
jgi:hypothetical protein